MTHQQSTPSEKYNVTSVVVKDVLFQTPVSGPGYVRAILGIGKRVEIQAVAGNEFVNEFVVASTSRTFRTRKDAQHYFESLRTADSLA